MKASLHADSSMRSREVEHILPQNTMSQAEANALETCNFIAPCLAFHLPLISFMYNTRLLRLSTFSSTIVCTVSFILHLLCPQVVVDSTISYNRRKNSSVLTSRVH